MARKRKQLGNTDASPYIFGGLLLVGLGLVGVTIWLIKKGNQ